MDETVKMAMIRSAARSGAASALRAEAGLTVKEVAAAVGVDASTLRRWEHGGSKPNTEAAVSWFDVLDNVASECDLPPLQEFITNARGKRAAYMAAPLTATDEDLEAACDLIRKEYPDHRTWDGARAFSGNAEWRSWWRLVLLVIDVVVVLPAADGTIGQGVYREISDAKRRNLPVRFIHQGEFVEADRVSLVKIENGFTPGRAYTVEVADE